MRLVVVILLMFVLFKNIMEVIVMATVFKLSLKKLLLAMLAAAVILCCCTGCGGNKTSGVDFAAEKTDVVFVLGCGNNRSSNLINTAFENYKVRNVLDIVAKYGGSVTFITNEGEPQAKHTKIEPVSAAYSPSQQRKIIAERTQQIVLAAKSAKATTEETNLIKTVKTASAYLDNSDGRQKVIFIVDNALMQTEGIINFSSINFAQVDNEQIVEYLEDERVFDGYLDLDGVQMQWMGFSATGGIQCEMTPEITLKLEQLWKEVFSRAGADVTVNSSVDIGDSANNGNLPFVSAVYIPENNFDLTNTVQRIDEEKLLFMPDSTEFVDLQEAEKTIMPFVDYLKNNKDINIVVAGMTATQPDAEACRELSLRRAEKVKSLLVENGIPEKRVMIVGLGCSMNDYRLKDLKEDGSIDEAAARHNRCILMANTECDAGKELIKLGGV